MTKKSGIVTILSTATPEQAPVIAQALVADRLVACINIMPVRSIYQWQGKTCDDSESLMIMKTREDQADAVIAGIKKLHSYDLPEIIVLPVLNGYPPYLDWVARQSAHQG